MTTSKQSDLVASNARINRAIASEIAEKSALSGAGAGVENRAVQKKPIIQRKPGEDEEIPIQRALIYNQSSTAQFFADNHNPGAQTSSTRTAFLQPKLSVNAPGDSYEIEADAMAEKVMRMKDPFSPLHRNDAGVNSGTTAVQRKCAACEEEEKVHRKENAGTEMQGVHELDNYVGSLDSSGSALPESSRRFFEPRFGRDFSNVRVHTDTVAAKSAQSINALAYTTGNNIVFNNGQYSPGSESGQRLLAHELTHVVQQKQNNSLQRQIQRDSDGGKVVVDDIPPIMIVPAKNDSKKSHKQAEKLQGQEQKIAHEAYFGLSDSFQSFVDLWLNAANTALQQATVPDDPTQKSNFYKALGGNMLWAATSLFAAWNPIVIGMSFVGAGIGSGVLANDPYPTGISEIATLLTQTRDVLYKETVHVRQDVAVECAQGNITGLEAQRKLLWSHIYPGTPFNSSDALRTAILKRINRGLAQFRRQYEQWLNGIEAEASRKAMDYCGHTFGGGDIGEHAARGGCNVSFTWSFSDELKKQRPFNPSLTF